MPRFPAPLVNLAKFALPVAIIGFLLWQIDEEHWQKIAAQDKNYSLIAAAVAVAVGAMSLAFIRWCVLVRAQSIQLSMVEAFRLGAIGFLLSFVSAGSVGGDVFKAAFLARRRPGRRVAAVASVLVDRGCGLYGLLLLVAGGLACVNVDDFETGDTGINLQSIRLATWTLIGLGTAVLAALILGGRGVDRAITRLQTVPYLGAVVERIGPPLRSFHDHPGHFALAVLLSLGVQGSLVISMLLIARGLYTDAPTMAEHFVIVPIGMLISALPVSPAGVGVLELAIESMYQVFLPAAAAASGTLVALVFEMVKLIVAGIGVAFYWTAPAEVTDAMEAPVPAPAP